jgi:hypothetical protein
MSRPVMGFLYLLQEVMWDKEDTVRSGNYNFFYGKGNENHQLETGSVFVYHKIVSAVKREEFYVLLTVHLDISV